MIEKKTWSQLKTTEEVMSWFAGFAEAQNLTRPVVRKVCVALDDLLSNIICYAYPAREGGEVKIILDLNDSVLRITVTDAGRPFDPLRWYTPDLHATVDNRKIGGLGIHLLRNLLDDVAYQRIDDRNVLVLTIAV